MNVTKAGAITAHPLPFWQTSRPISPCQDYTMGQLRTANKRRKRALLADQTRESVAKLAVLPAAAVTV
jgi:hypothetical protein